jgi:hypothetical protein
MNADQRQRQARACHIQFKRLQRKGKIDDELSCHAYAAALLRKRDLASLLDLSDVELNALRDALNGKKPKQYAKLEAVACQCGITDVAAYVGQMARNRGPQWAWLYGATWDTLSLTQAWRLTQIFQARIEKTNRAAAEYRKANGLPPLAHLPKV